MDERGSGASTRAGAADSRGCAPRRAADSVTPGTAHALRVSGAGGWIGQRLLGLAHAAGAPAAPIGRAALLDERAALPIAPGDVVVHLAAIAHRPAGAAAAAEYERVNRDLAVSCARRARSAGARRFVFVSTAAMMRPGRARALVETDAPEPRDAYARAKRDAERLLAPLHEPGRFELVVLRPPLVYGPGARANFARLLALADSPWPLPLAGATAARSMVYLDNLVDALLHAAREPAAAGGTFLVADGTERSAADWVRAVRAARGRPARLFAPPDAWVRAAARAARRWPAYERLFLPLRVDAAALRATGWRPPVGVDDALARTLAAREPCAAARARR